MFIQTQGMQVAQVQDEELSVEEAKERKIMKLLLKVKNGTPPQRKSALRQLTDKAREFGAGPLFNQILPLLMAPTLEDQERHLLVKASFAKLPMFRGSLTPLEAIFKAVFLVETKLSTLSAGTPALQY